MGIKQSFLGCKIEDEESQIPVYYLQPILQLRQNYDHYTRNGDYTAFSAKIFCLHKVFYNALKSIVHKSRCSVFKPRNRADPILPVVYPKSSILNDPLSVETIVLSSPDLSSFSGSSPDGGPSPFDPRPCFLDPDEETISSQQWPVENSSNSISHEDHVIVSVPNFRYSLYDTSVTEEEVINSAVIIEQDIAPTNVACVEEEREECDEEEKVVIKNVVVDPTSNIINDPVLVGITSTVIIEESAPHNVACVEGSTEDEEKEKVVIKNVVVDDVVINAEAKWIKHYCNLHRILLVGEGDFSFSASLAVAFCEASNMIATSLDSKEFLKKNYQKAPANIQKLRSRGCKVMHGVDATKILNHALLGLLTFDRIIYNFPFAGFFKDLPRQSQLRRHRRLVSLFMKNAKEMISEDGEIHITHKTNEFHNEWKLELVASSHRLRLIEAAPFHHCDFPGYNTKRGFGGDNNFNCYPSKTYKFGHKTGRY